MRLLHQLGHGVTPDVGQYGDIDVTGATVNDDRATVDTDQITGAPDYSLGDLELERHNGLWYIDLG